MTEYNASKIIKNGDIINFKSAQEGSTTSDHLEESALVGENYALTDTLFKQLTPKLADSTVEANVGDVAANTQVHIQRLGSGTASNELKLKLKSAGSPTTGLTVEVRKGIKVDVSDAEAYWYGNEVIATGTIAYGDISNDWSEITVTLDNEFGGTEGELLDIVLYQTGSIVNASNYYIMACDSTQWSEGFSYVCVNGTTRTRQKLMPYCVSSGFAQAMLSKTATIDKNETLYNDITSLPLDGTFNVNGFGKLWLYAYNGDGYNFTIDITHNGTTKSYTAIKQNTIAEFGDNIAIYNGDTYKISSTYSFSDGRITLYFKYGLLPDKPIKFFSIKPIGEKLTCYLFGMLPTGERRDGN